MSNEPLPPSRAETYVREFLKLNVGDGPDKLVTLPASIVADLLTDIDQWRNIATRKETAH